MTTTEPLGGYAPPAPPRTLRRSRTDRVGAGVAGGLGEYFAVDPVLFRVLFATAAFFGGAGLLGYLLAWAAIPEAGTEHAPVDTWIHGFRQRRAPFLLIAVAAIVLFWAVAFSWWSPGPVVPVILVVIVIVLIFGRRGGQRGWPRTNPQPSAVPPPRAGVGAGPAVPGAGVTGPAAPAAGVAETATLDEIAVPVGETHAHGEPDALPADGLTDPEAAGNGAASSGASDSTAVGGAAVGGAAVGGAAVGGAAVGGAADSAPSGGQPFGSPTLPFAAPTTDRQPPAWVGDLRQWAAESREASRLRRRRALPVRIAGLVTLVVALAVLGLVDAAHGIPIPTYLWFALAILGGALLTGLVLRRTPWSLTALLVPTVVGLIAFGGTHASLSDGIGQKEWRPTTHLASHYRLAFGQAILDLRSLPPITTPQAIDVTVASGQVRVIAPASLNVALRAEIHFGNLTVDGAEYDDGDGSAARGVNVDRTVQPPTGVAGAPLLVRVHLADGNVALVRG